MGLESQVKTPNVCLTHSTSLDIKWIDNLSSWTRLSDEWGSD